MKDLINKLKDLRNVAQTIQSLDEGNMPTPKELQKTMEDTLGVSIEELDNMDISSAFEDSQPKVEVKFINKSTNQNPSYIYKGDSGFDFRANLKETMVIEPMGRALVPTGLFFEIPFGYELQVRPKSGLAIKKGIMVLNTPGTVDSNYRGEIQIILINLSKEDYIIEHGDRIAQGVVCPILNKDWSVMSEVDVLSPSDRQDGAFGSTGIK
tara:strand:- start:9338 stop:9967 length:630 start_codon:yes stop_codon:yes gene_type:complete